MNTHGLTLRSALLRILLVENQKNDRLVFRQVFQKSDMPFDITECTRGEEAVDYLRVHSSDVDVVVSNFHLPGMNGLELLAHIRAMYPPLSFVMLMSICADRVALAALRAGANDYLIKDPKRGYLELLSVVIPKSVHSHLEQVDQIIFQPVEEPLQAKHDKLEQQINVRTRELADANARLQQEIADRKRYEEALRKSEERLQLASDSTREGIWDWDISSGTVFFSAHWVASLGFSPGELQPHITTWEHLIHPDDVQHTMQALHAHLEGQTPFYECENRLLKKDGTWRWNYDRGKVVERNEHGKAIRMVSIDTDITDRKNTEEALRQTKNRLIELQRREMEHVSAELEKTRAALVHHTQLATLGQFSASIAHELRNPLGTIRNAVFLLNRHIDSDNQLAKKYLEIIDEEIASSDQIIINLLEMARGKEPVKQKVDLRPLLQAALESCHCPSTIHQHISLDPDPYFLWCDPSQIQQVFRNLFQNAAQAMEHAGTILITAHQKTGNDEIFVQDTGPGISEEDRPHLFDPLFTTKTKGTGLGLTISQQIIDRHGGTLTLSNIPTHTGTSFCMRLPQYDPLRPS